MVEPLKLLVVEDNVADALVVRESLGSLTSWIHVAPGVRDACLALETLRPDVAIVDLGLPDGQWTDVRDALERTQPQRVPIIVFTASLDPLDMTGVLQAGADAVLRKPEHFADARVLVRTVERLAGRRPL